MTDDDATPFVRRDLRGARFEQVDLSDATFRMVGLHRVRMRGVELIDVDVSGEVERLVINGVDVAPYVEAELARRDPAYAGLRSGDVAGLRAAWTLSQERWAETVQRARRLPETLLHESVEGEWSFVQTLRHLVYATEIWILRVVHGDPRPFHPLSLPFDGAEPHPDMPWDREARPPLEEVLALRADRADVVRRLLEGLDDDGLARVTTPVDGPSWPPPLEVPVREAVHVVLNEEYWHRAFAERDLAVLEERSTT